METSGVKRKRKTKDKTPQGDESGSALASERIHCLSTTRGQKTFFRRMKIIIPVRGNLDTGAWPEEKSSVKKKKTGGGGTTLSLWRGVPRERG